MSRQTVLVESASRTRLWAGRIISGLAALFLLFDATGKLLRLAPVVEGTTRFGYTSGVILPLGIVLALCTILYLFPRTAVLGAVLLTGYLGGAVSTHVRVNDVLFNIIFPVILGALLWFGLWLRDVHLQRLLPFVSGIERQSKSDLRGE